MDGAEDCKIYPPRDRSHRTPPAIKSLARTRPKINMKYFPVERRNIIKMTTLPTLARKPRGFCQQSGTFKSDTMTIGIWDAQVNAILGLQGVRGASDLAF